MPATTSTSETGTQDHPQFHARAAIAEAVRQALDGWSASQYVAALHQQLFVLSDKLDGRSAEIVSLNTRVKDGDDAMLLMNNSHLKRTATLREQAERIRNLTNKVSDLREELSEAEKKEEILTDNITAKNAVMDAMRKDLSISQENLDVCETSLKHVGEQLSLNEAARGALREGLHDSRNDYEGQSRRYRMMAGQLVNILELSMPDFSKFFGVVWTGTLDQAIEEDRDVDAFTMVTERFQCSPTHARDIVTNRAVHLKLLKTPTEVQEFVENHGAEYDIFHGTEFWYVGISGAAEIPYLAAINDREWHYVSLDDGGVRAGCSAGYGWYRVLGVDQDAETVDFADPDPDDLLPPEEWEHLTERSSKDD